MTYRLGMIAAWLLCVVASLVALVWMLAAIVACSPRALSIAIGFDQVSNVTAGGDEDETFSSRCWRFRGDHPYRTLRWLIDGAFRLMGQKNHCRAACETEMAKASERLAELEL